MGKYNYALVITNISTLLMTISVWFWNDINDELKEYDLSYFLATTDKSMEMVDNVYIPQFLNPKLTKLELFSFINSAACEIWLQPSQIFILLSKIYLIFSLS